MINYFQVLDFCDEPAIKVAIIAVKVILSIVRWVIPIILIIYGTVDIFKAMTNGDEKEQKKAWTTFGKRILYAVAIFLIPFLVELAFSLIGNVLGSTAGDAEENTENFFTCYGKQPSTASDNRCWVSDSSGKYTKTSALNEEDCGKKNGIWQKDSPTSASLSSKCWVSDGHGDYYVTNNAQDEPQCATYYNGIWSPTKP